MTVLRFGVVAVALGLAACGGNAEEPTPVRTSGGGCPVTPPSGRVPGADGGFNYGDGSLAVALWPRGKLVAGRLPDGSSYAEVKPDGSIVAKLGWWRGVEGRLDIRGERLDRAAPPLRAYVPSGYGAAGFQATALMFPTRGCWKVVGSVGGATLTFVVRVSVTRAPARRGSA